MLTSCPCAFDHTFEQWRNETKMTASIGAHPLWHRHQNQKPDQTESRENAEVLFLDFSKRVQAQTEAAAMDDSAKMGKFSERESTALVSRIKII